MKLTLRIALRYLFSKKKTNVINILSLLSVVGVMLSTAALVIILSVFNGFEKQLLDAYNPVSPDVKIVAKEGKRFLPDSVLLAEIQQQEGVACVVPTISDRAVLQFGNRTTIATVLGIDEPAYQIYDFESLMQSGSFYTKYDDKEFIVLGYPIAARLRANMYGLEPIYVYAAKRGRKSSASQLAHSFKKEALRPSGVYDGDASFSAEYVVVSYDFAQKLFSMGAYISSWELKLKEGYAAEDVAERVRALVGERFVVKDRYQLNETLFKMLKLEKFFVFATLAIILLIAAFNIVGSLSMIIIDKKEDVAILKSMGATAQMVREIFVLESLFISLFGAFVGLLLGLLISWLQWQFEFLSMQASYGAQPFPVVIQWLDILYIVLLALLVGFFIALFTVRSIPKRLTIDHIH